MGKTHGNNRADSDVLRAADIIPPFGGQGRRKRPQGTPQAAVGKDVSLRPSSTSEERGEVPRLDLTEGLMASQRMASAVRRKSPGRKTGPVDSDSPAPAVEDKYAPIPQPPEQQHIIAAIVARDIDRFCRGQVILPP